MRMTYRTEHHLQIALAIADETGADNAIRKHLSKAFDETCGGTITARTIQECLLDLQELTNVVFRDDEGPAGALVKSIIAEGMVELEDASREASDALTEQKQAMQSEIDQLGALVHPAQNAAALNLVKLREAERKLEAVNAGNRELRRRIDELKGDDESPDDLYPHQEV